MQADRKNQDSDNAEASDSDFDNLVAALKSYNAEENGEGDTATNIKVECLINGENMVVTADS